MEINPSLRGGKLKKNFSLENMKPATKTKSSLTANHFFNQESAIMTNCCTIKSCSSEGKKIKLFSEAKRQS
jgi:hypothetical protein